MPRKTIADLQRMKERGQKICAGVVYEAQMTRIFERAGVDMLSVGDSLGRALLNYPNSDDYPVDDMLVFARAVCRTAEKAVVNVDLPTQVCDAGPKEVERVARILKNIGADMTKIDIRTREEELFDEVHAVIASGIAAYPQIGFPVAPDAPRHGSSEDHDHVMKWAQAAQDAGAVMIDLTMVTPDIYRDVTRSMSIPVIGGQAGPEADGKIWVAWSLVGYLAQTIDAEGDAPSAAKYIYDIVSKAVGDVHAGAW